VTGLAAVIVPADGRPVDDVLPVVSGALVDRGPDGETVRAAGHLRLAVRHRNGPPVVHDTSDLLIAFDGELYATGPLRAALELAGRPAGAAATDLELIAAAYTAWGVGGLGRLDGIWALVIHDRRVGRTHLAVDRAGAGALVRITLTDGTLVLASEPRALLAVPGVPAAADDAVVRRFLATGAGDDGEDTFFVGIQRVPAGHVVTVGAHPSAARAVRYPVPDPTTPAAAGAAFAGAVTARCSRAGERLGVRLGHGLAGTMLLHHVTAATTPAVVLTVTTPPFAGPDEPRDAAVLSALGVTARSVDAGADRLGDELDDLVRVLGEPVADFGVAALRAVVSEVAGTVDALVDPAGADVVLGAPGAGRTRGALDGGTLLTDEPSDTGRRPTLSAARVGRVAGVLRAADRIGSRAGVRVRLPYLDAIAGPALGAAAAIRPGGGKGVLLGATSAALPRPVVAAAPDLRPVAPTADVLLRLKNRVYGELLSESFTNRPWWRAGEVVAAFERFIQRAGGKGARREHDAAVFWRFLAVELWMREHVDERQARVEAPAVVRGPLEPNPGKGLEITVDGERWLRFPVRTELFAKGDALDERIPAYAATTLAALRADPAYASSLDRPWYLVVSEKIVAIAQGRSYFVWDIAPTWWARTLSRFVVRTPYGIGLGSPWTMQLAIQEAGLPRILAASAAGAVGKVVGRRGVFYQVAGHSVRAIDGPTEYSAYPSNVSAKLAPARPDEVSAELAAALRSALVAGGDVAAAEHLAGVVVIDANDIGRNVLGSAADRPPGFFEALFADNPLGQGSELTPLAVAVRAPGDAPSG